MTGRVESLGLVRSSEWLCDEVSVHSSILFDVLRVYSIGILYSVTAQSLRCLASGSVCLVFIQVIIKVQLQIIHFIFLTLATLVIFCAYPSVQTG